MKALTLLLSLLSVACTYQVNTTTPEIYHVFQEGNGDTPVVATCHLGDFVMSGGCAADTYLRVNSPTGITPSLNGFMCQAQEGYQGNVQANALCMTPSKVKE